MRPSILIGIVIGVVILAAALLAPMLRSSEAKTADQATRQAILAQRKLARVDQNTARLEAIANTQQATGETLQQAVTTISDQLREISTDFGKLARQARERAAEHGFEDPKIQPVSPDITGVERAIQGFQKALEQNEGLLRDAIADARAAVQTDREAFCVSQVLGMTQYAQAAARFAEAMQLRGQQAIEQARLLDLAIQHRYADGQASYYRGFDVEPVENELDAGIRELTELKSDADREARNLSALVNDRKQALEVVKVELQQLQQQLQQVESQGFELGNDESFSAYRQQYESLSARLRGLELRHEELLHGTRAGATLVGDNLASAEVRGGTELVGLQSLEGKLETVRRRAVALADSITTLQERRDQVNQLGQRMHNEGGRYRNNLAELSAAEEQALSQVLATAAQARDKEEEALQAAKAAAQAFSQSQRAADAWVRSAREAQRERDPDRKNTRLRAIIDEPYLGQFAKSAEAATRVLAGYVYAERVESIQSLLRDMMLHARMADTTFDAAEYESALSEARTAGLETLEQARTTYDSISSAPANTAWIKLAALSAANHLTARLAGDVEGQAYADVALQKIQEAVAQAAGFPYAVNFVAFRDHLTSRPKLGSEPATEPPSDETDTGEDFFLMGDDENSGD